MTKEEMIAAVGKVISDNWPAPVVPSAPTPPPPMQSPTVAIAAADIVCQASADLSFIQQRDFSVQTINTHTPIEKVPQAGIHGTKINGETMRFGRVQDPANPVRRALSFMVAPSDPKTSGGWRTELSFGKNIKHGSVYFAALSAYVFDWGGEDTQGLYGIQLHSGDDSKGYSPSFGVYVADGGKNFRIENRSQGAPTVRHAGHPIAFGRWQDFTFRLKLGFPGFLQAWVDGRQIVDYAGNLGFKTPGLNDYFKFGWYNWTAFTQPRKVLLRNPVVVLDPGSKYSPQAMIDFVNRSNP